jgi:hypothetical protein
VHKNFGTFEITSLRNVPGHYLRKYGILSKENPGTNCETLLHHRKLNQRNISCDWKTKNGHKR